MRSIITPEESDASSPGSSDDDDDCDGLLHIKNLMKRKGNYHSTSERVALVSSHVYDEYEAERPKSICSNELSDMATDSRMLSEIETRFVKWSAWVREEDVNLIKHDWPVQHRQMDPQTRFITLLWMKNFSISNAYPRDSLLRAMNFYDIFMSQHTGLLREAQSLVVAASILSLVSKLEGLAFLTEEFAKSCLLEIATFEAGNKGLWSMDSTIMQSMAAMRVKFLSLMKMNLHYPTCVDWLRLYLENIKLVKPELFGDAVHIDASCAGPLSTHRMISLLESCYLNIASLKVPMSCLAASVISYAYGSTLSENINLLFEAAPPLSAVLYSCRPFSSWSLLIDKACEIIHGMSFNDKVLVINAHPRIGAPKQTLSKFSAVEQGYTVNAPSNDQQSSEEECLAHLKVLNEEYEAKFGFKFVVFVNKRPKTEIISVIKERMNCVSVEEELEVGLMEMMAIARDRLSTFCLA